MKRPTLPGRKFKGPFITTRQGSIERLEGVLPNIDSAKTTVCQVKYVHTDRMTVDVVTNNGATVRNVQILTKGGLIDSEVWGELEVPAIGTYVVLGFVNGNAGFPFVLGYLFPYGYSKYQSNQTPVNSSAKAYTKKLLEAVDDKTYRRIFKSGTTLEIEADGTIIVETPSGSFVKVQESDGSITIEASGNEVNINSDSAINLNGSSKTLVTHAALNTALQAMLTALNANFALKLDTAGTPGTTTLDISSAEASKVKTG